jgi:hypothetical protein
MEKVVYLLGAGFSAPLGIPVMNSFLTRSKDLYFTDPARFSHFQEVFDTINELSVIKNYYSADLFNIEEILSILEMREYLEGSSLKDTFIQYISDVIQHYTPEIIPYQRGKLPGNWYQWLFGTNVNRSWQQYGSFIGAICNLTFTGPRGGFAGEYNQIYCEIETNPETVYSIITLNYDLVPESVVSFIQSNYSCQVAPTLRVAKLHGSVDTKVIVPPT